MRYHPAVVAQKAATVDLLSDGRFTLGLGAGENLNEHVVGRAGRRSTSATRCSREALTIITALFDGGYVDFAGDHYRVDSAKVWDLPQTPVPIGVAVSGEQSVADVRTAGRPPDRRRARRRAGAAAGTSAHDGPHSRKIGQLPVCWGTDRDASIDRAHELFRWFGGGWKVNAELPGPAGFAGASQFVDQGRRRRLDPLRPRPRRDREGGARVRGRRLHRRRAGPDRRRVAARLPARSPSASCSRPCAAEAQPRADGHPLLDVGRRAGERRGEVPRAVGGDEDVVLDPDADAAHLLGHEQVVGLEVEARARRSAPCPRRGRPWGRPPATPGRSRGRPCRACG